MKTLTAERAREVLSYDPKTGNLTWRKPTGKKPKVGNEAGCAHTQANGYQYVQVGIDGGRYRKTTVIWLIVHGCKPIGDIDHVNGNSTDDRLCNLREATRTQNMANKRMHKNNRSGIKGVFWDTQRKKWRAQVRKDRKNHYAGHFTDKYEAGAAYLAKARELHGNFATDRR